VPAYVPGHGDLIWTDFDPTKGREQVGWRPALVVSSAAFYREHWLGHCLSDYVPRSAVSDECCSPTRPTDHRRDPDQPYPQHRHDGPAHPLCRRCRAVGGRATRPRKAEHLHNDLTIKSFDGSV